MILQPREYVSPEDRRSLRPTTGDAVMIIGDPRKYIVTAAGMRWYNLKNDETGEEAIAKAQNVVRWAPAKEPVKKEELQGTFEDINEEFES